jgi:DNA polymerase-1
VAHNAKFEWSWMNRSGLDTSQYLPYDTMLGEFCLAGNRRWKLDLGSVAQRYGYPGKHPLIDALMGGGVCPSDMPRGLLEARAIRDVETTRGIMLVQREHLRREGLLACFFTRCALVPVLAEIEATGLYLDADRVRRETRMVLAELKKARIDIDSVTGGINPASTVQMGKYLYETLKFKELVDRRGNPIRNKPNKAFPYGAPLTDSDTLDKLEAETPEQKEFIKLRQEFGKWNAKYTKTLSFLSHVVDNCNSLFHGRFNQTVAQTHRLTSSSRKLKMMDPEKGKLVEKGMQLQNMDSDYKNLFTPRDPDSVYVEVDGSQLEFIVAAMLGQDVVAATDIVTGRDVHRATASEILNIPPEKVTTKQRKNAKADTFGPLFGKVSGTKGQRRYFEYFKERYKGIVKTQEKWIGEVLETGCLKTITGLKFYWPGCRMKSDGYVEHSTNIKNYPIQSLATADIMPISLTQVFWRCKVAGLRVLFTNTVHDSIAMECHKDDVEALKEIAYECFLERTYEYLDQVYGIKFNVPLGAAITVGSHLGEGEEMKVSRPYSNVQQLVSLGGTT